MIVVVGEEHVLDAAGEPDLGDKQWTRPPGFHSFIFRAPAEGVDAAAMQARWLDAAPSVVAEPAYRSHGCRYVQTHPSNEDLGLPGICPYAVVDEFWTRTVEDAISLCGKLDDSGAMKALVDACAAPAATVTVIARPHAVFSV
jgi:hypothetical protein